MDKIVGDLQDYARPLDPERQSVSVRALIDEIIHSLPHIDGVEVHADLSDLTIDSEPHLIRRVFTSLILNALQAMPREVPSRSPLLRTDLLPSLCTTRALAFLKR